MVSVLGRINAILIVYIIVQKGFPDNLCLCNRVYDGARKNPKTEEPMKKKNNLVIASLVVILVYSVILKSFGLSTFDFSDFIGSLKPYLLHSVALLGAFVFSILAVMKAEANRMLWTAIFCLAGVLTYFPLSLILLVPTGLSAYAWWQETH